MPSPSSVDAPSPSDKKPSNSNDFPSNNYSPSLIPSTDSTTNALTPSTGPIENTYDLFYAFIVCCIPHFYILQKRFNKRRWRKPWKHPYKKVDDTENEKTVPLTERYSNDIESASRLREDMDYESHKHDIDETSSDEEIDLLVNGAESI